MDDLALARAIHVVAILFWIGGVAFVTLIVLPWVRRHYQSLFRSKAPR